MLANDTLIAAINERRTIRLNYHPGARTIEPHAYGTGSSGQHLLRAYQTEGASASGEHRNWKLFRLDRVRSLEMLNQTFDGPRPEYRQNDKAMRRIFAQL